MKGRTLDHHDSQHSDGSADSTRLTMCHKEICDHVWCMAALCQLSPSDGGFSRLKATPPQKMYSRALSPPRYVMHWLWIHTLHRIALDDLGASYVSRSRGTRKELELELELVGCSQTL